MASMIKHKANIIQHIRHNMRELPSSKEHSNKEIDSTRTKDNFEVISRGNTAEEVNAYRKQITKDIFHYKRKDLVQAVEVVVALPDDTPPEAEKSFFTEACNYVASTLPMGEKAIFQAVVHKDEGVVIKDGVAITKSRPHIHIMYVPAVIDTKHDGYNYKMCADQLTKRARLKQFHPEFQKWLNKAGVKGTVYSGKTGGKNLTVEALKAITKETGMTIDEIRSLKDDKERLMTVNKDNDRIVAEMTANIDELTKKLTDEINKAESLHDRLDEASRTNWSLRNENTQLKKEILKNNDITSERVEQNHTTVKERSNGWGDAERGEKAWQIDRSF